MATDYTDLTTEVLRLLRQQKNIEVTGPRQTLIDRLKRADKTPAKPTRQSSSNSKQTAKQVPATNNKRKKSSTVTTPAANNGDHPDQQSDAEDTINIDDGGSPTSQQPVTSNSGITVEQITSIVSSIVESKMAASPHLQNAGNSIPSLGDPNAVHQLIQPTPSAPINPGDIAAHVDGKTRTAIVKGKYVDFVSLLHENSSVSSNVTDLLMLTVNGESVPLAVPSQRRSKRVPIASFDRWLAAFSVYCTILLTAFPHRAVEMFAYLNIIQSTHKKFLGLAWLAYDLDFRRQAALDPTLSWAKIHSQLYLEKFTGLSRSACSTCGGADHYSHACPLSTHRDSPGTFNEPCQKFNRGYPCITTPCSFPHRCSIEGCKESHPATSHTSHHHGKTSKSADHKCR